MEAITLGAGAKIGETLLEEGLKQGGKIVLKQLLSKFDKEKDPVIFFNLSCSFKELPSFDIASSQLNAIIEKTSMKSQEFSLGKHTYRYILSWDEVDGCEIPNTSWEPDTYAFPDEDQENEDWSIASTCVSGFTLWIFPVSQGNNKESIIVSAYRMLAEVKNKLIENPRLSIRKATIFALVRADPSMGSRIEKKMRKKMEEQNLEGTIYVEPVSNKMRLLTVPLRETLYALALADSFKRFWGIIK